MLFIWPLNDKKYFRNPGCIHQMSHVDWLSTKVMVHMRTNYEILLFMLLC